MAGLSVLLLAVLAAIGPDFPAEPAPGVYLVDEAGLLDDAARARIAQLCAQSERAAQAPIRVVVLRSLASRGAAGGSVERYARALFNHWQLGSAARNRGMLLVVAHQDRRMRIELGAHWGGGTHAGAQQIVDALIVPQFKRGDFAGGITLGVAGLDAMAREVPLPRAPGSALGTGLGLLGLGVAALAVVSLARSGRSGVAGTALAAMAWPFRQLAAAVTAPRDLVLERGTDARRRRLPRIRRRQAAIVRRRRAQGHGCLPDLAVGSLSYGPRARFGGGMFQSLGGGGGFGGFSGGGGGFSGGGRGFSIGGGASGSW